VGGKLPSAVAGSCGSRPCRVVAVVVVVVDPGSLVGLHMTSGVAGTEVVGQSVWRVERTSGDAVPGSVVFGQSSTRLDRRQWLLKTERETHLVPAVQ